MINHSNRLFISVIIFIIGISVFIHLLPTNYAMAEIPTEEIPISTSQSIDYGIQETKTSCFDFNWVVMYSIASLLIIIFLSLQLNITGFNFFQLFLFFAIGGWITTILNECGISYLGLIIAIVLTFLFW
ncbi:MAG: hypothetical protein WCO06_04600 [Candidatus Roizmanbacteria bacterium]